MSAGMVVLAVIAAAMVAIFLGVFVPTWVAVSLVLSVVAILVVGGEPALGYSALALAAAGVLRWVARRRRM